MDILVTGGTVFVSRAAAEWFSARGDRVFVLNRGSRPQPDGAVLVRADRRDLGGILKRYCFDAVLDMTAYSGEDVRLLLDALGDFGQYVLLSSSAVYPETLPQPFRESQPVGLNCYWDDYGIGKIDAESELLARIPTACIIRPPYLCGCGNNLYREAFIFECAEIGLPVFLPERSDLRLQFCCISELCKLIEQVLMKQPSAHILNVGDEKMVSAEEWIRICSDIAGRSCEIRYASETAPVREYFPFRNYNYCLDVTSAMSISPYSTPLEASLKAGYAWWIMHREEVRRKPFIDYIAKHLF
ncbi:MAG: dTDP-glucose 4,6-dehydratase [Oscillospiraceae bacterium]|nr:dTDP-glucose 4,6-dehydratase [Oscillospiraceae bacterium]